MKPPSSPSLTPMESLFCGLYAGLGNSIEAARLAGYKRPGRTGNRLLARADIQAEIHRRLGRQAEQAASRALTGLERVAFGGIGDAAVLLDRTEPLSRDQLAELDLYAVSELKSPKGGGMEIKFYDRLKALELLLQHAAPSGEQAHSLYQALEQTARELGAADGKCHGD